MQEKIKIKCPCCSKVATVKNIPGIENAIVKCSACNQQTPFKMWKQVVVNDDKTLYAAQSQKSDDTTVPLAGLNTSIGVLVSQGNNNETYQLKMGQNVIGRKASASSASIQISTGESKRMSREHLVIEVKKITGRGLVHYVSLYKERLNPTFIGNEKIEYGSCLILNDGDIIKMPDCTLLFTIPDEESTEINN